MEENREVSPLNYDLHELDDFEELLMSLSGRSGGKPGRSVYDSMRSSLFHLYRGYGQIMSLKFAGNLTLFFKGLKRDVARRNHNAGVKLTEGKEPLSFSVLRHFVPRFSNITILTGNTASIHSGHLSWDGDALAIHFGHTKNDQDSTRPRDARHVYANPFNPEICPVLSLAIYGAVLGLSNSKIFPGGNQYDRFSKILKRVMETEEMKEILANEGLVASDIGTHSARKGSATFVSSCSNGGPSAAAICIRAGWTLPGVQDTYIRYESAGDRIVGRYVAGLPFDDTGFAMLPPFFPMLTSLFVTTSTCASTTYLHTYRGLVDFYWLYHWEYLRTVLGPQHPLYRNPVFGNVELISQLKQRVTCRTAWSSDRIRPTAVPPHVHILVSMEKQSTQLQRLSQSVTELGPTLLEQITTELPRCQRSLSTTDLHASLSQALVGCGITEILESLRSNNHHQMHNDAAHDGVIDEHSDTLHNAPQTLSLVNERFSRVTADFHIPGMSLMTAWEHWCCGDPSGRIGPYRFLQWRGLSSSKKRKTLSNYRCMMMEIQTKIPHCSWISAPTIQQAREMLQSVLAKLPVSDVTSKKRQRRKDQLKWSTALNVIRANHRVSARNG
ncbi:LOW QUALITY PROTEIN: Hypothetical protein PHPALM_5026 [Phytophthora palmivora]|uniref:Uncharacterized protein n=1 Tax=Phytophthora palmivora TaxID=4796 RepID=A0A2P4YID7_9STRA|nr:LOW QUALITY PROTEIN: Hypothetical protein PHPALM_5026 [Phytophthora palmivora]